MANTAEEPVADGKRYKIDSFRVTVLAVAASGVYGSGIIMVMWSAWKSVQAAHASLPIPVLPWAVSFLLVVGGMLSVIYGFFFRPRELRISDTQVALVYWDGNGKKMDRAQVESVEARNGRIVIRGKGARKKLVVGKIFQGWEAILAELGSWAPAPRG